MDSFRGNLTKPDSMITCDSKVAACIGMRKGDTFESYRVNGKDLQLGIKEYMPDLMHDRAIGFLREHQSTPFFLYYSLSHVHGDIQPTPDSPPDSKDLFADNILYMDKLIGNLVAELEALKLRENTLIIFMGDNGTGKGQSALSTIGGRSLSGMKGSMLECGGLVPMIANWPGRTPAGEVSANLLDSTDLLPTFAEIVGGNLPENTMIDGQSFAQQLRGEKGKQREWIYNQLAAMWYVRDAQWKLNHLGELYDMSDAPFSEKLVEADAVDIAAVTARSRLTAVLAKLNPAGGILDTGDGIGRHANKDKKKGVDERDKPVTSPESTVSEKESADAVERATKFDKLDKEKVGKLTRDFFTTHQSDAEGAGERFDNYDSNRDGFMTRDEFIYKGKKP